MSSVALASCSPESIERKKELPKYLTNRRSLVETDDDSDDDPSSNGRRQPDGSRPSAPVGRRSVWLACFDYDGRSEQASSWGLGPAWQPVPRSRSFDYDVRRRTSPSGREPEPTATDPRSFSKCWHERGPIVRLVALLPVASRPVLARSIDYDVCRRPSPSAREPEPTATDPRSPN